MTEAEAETEAGTVTGVSHRISFRSRSRVRPRSRYGDDAHAPEVGRESLSDSDAVTVPAVCGTESVSVSDADRRSLYLILSLSLPLSPLLASRHCTYFRLCFWRACHRDSGYGP